MLINNPNQNYLLKHQGTTDPRQQRFLQSCEDQKHECFNEVDFEKGRGSGLAAGLRATKRFRFVDGQLCQQDGDGRWVPVPNRRPSRKRWTPPRVHVATGRKMSKR